MKQIKTILENSFSNEKGVSYEKIKSIPLTSKPHLRSEGKAINIGTEESF